MSDRMVAVGSPVQLQMSSHESTGFPGQEEPRSGCFAIACFCTDILGILDGVLSEH